MAFPTNITKEHLLKAIEKIDDEGFPPDSDSQYYDVEYNGKKYPPKVIVSYANLFANGEELDRNTFKGGVGTKCFKLLEANGFPIIKKDAATGGSFYDELTSFISVAKKQVTGKGTTGEAKDFNRKIVRYFQDLKVDVSFGMGRATSIPWISFLQKGQTTSNGIYPVYLFYKEKDVLILAYGVSEKNVPAINWNLPASKSVEEFFRKNNLGKPKNYGQSFVLKTYDTKKPLNEEEVNNDLLEIIEAYKKLLSGPSSSNEAVPKQKAIPPSKKPVQQINQKEFEHTEFFKQARAANFFINESLTLRFIASLLTKPFVILTGLSGSGKTKLAQAFASWICENNSQYSIVPVGADWTNREPLLGFPNALQSGEYIKPDNRALDLIIEASDNPTKPYFLILDEMNLSHVERYFADFLSVMESRGSICLHTGNESWDGVPSEITLPKNLFIIGTVNIDETTYMFSPKVLDRANVIEFRVTANEMEAYLNNNQTLDLGSIKAAGANMAVNFVEIATNKVKASDTQEMSKALITFFSELKKTGAEFGYRSAAEILRFAAVINKIESGWSMRQIIDSAIMQKLLPKVHGSTRKLGPVLKTLGKLCLENDEKIEDFISSKTEINYDDETLIKYPVSFEKILRMYHNLLNNGFTSYAEA